MTAQTDHSEADAGRIIISVDAMGGDAGPTVVVAGMARFAQAEPDVGFVLHGPVTKLKPLVDRRDVLAGRVELREAAGVVSMEDKPSHVLRNGKDTSMWSAVESVRDGEAPAAVSCGNTGALMAVSMIRLRKLAGVSRPAIAILFPSSNTQGFNVMLDAGADIKADAGDLLQYALMGASYARNGLALERPRIGLLNVGTEEHKGRSELKEAHGLISEFADKARFEFVGFVEGSDLAGNVADVIVTDGFTGNVAIKTGESTARFIGDSLRQAFRYSFLSRLASLLAITSLQRLKSRIDPRQVNGGVFLGLNGTVVKSHGSADAIGVAAAIKLAADLARSGFTERLAARVASAAELSHDDAGPAEIWTEEQQDSQD